MKERLNYLDGIKGIACLMVAAQHFYALFGYVFWGTDFLAAKTELFYSGTWCVRLFFMISAFLLANSIYNDCSSRKVRDTVIKRYLRLALPVFIVTLFIWLMSQCDLFYNMKLTHICSDPDYTGGYEEKRPLFQVFRTSFITTVFAGNCEFNNKFWMITPLFYGNMLALLLAVLTYMGKQKSQVAVYLCFIATTVLILAMFHRYFPFVLGTVLAYWKNNTNITKKQNERSKIGYSLLLLLGLLISEFYSILLSALEETVLVRMPVFDFLLDHNFYFALGIFMILLAVTKLCWVQRILEIKPLRFLGDCSYYVFLVHWPIMCSLSAWIYLKYSDVVNQATLARVIFTVTILAIVGVARIFTLTYEKWCNQFTKWILGKLR